MEYLVCRNSDLDTKALIDAFNRHRVSYKAATSATELGDLTFVANGAVFNSETTGRYFSGSAFFGRHFISNFCGLSAEELELFSSSYHDNPLDISGTYTFIEWKRSEPTVQIYFDFLNNAPCYYYSDRHVYAVSNNIHILAEWMRLSGLPLERRFSPYLAEGVFYCGLAGGSLYRGIEPVEQDQFLVLGATLAVRQVRSFRDAYADLSYRDLIAAAGDRIAQRVATLAELPPTYRLVLDVTGGMDSRMLLAAVARTGSFERWEYNRIFPFPSPDGNFAEMIGERFGMRRCNLAFASPSSPYDQFAKQVYHSQGVENKAGYHPNALTPGLVRLHGGYGELGGKSMDTKRFFRRVEGVPTRDELLANYLQSMTRVGYDRVFSDSYRRWATELVNSRIDGILSEGFSLEEMPAIFYSRTKARSHFGYLSHLRSMRVNYPDVLKDPLLVEMARRIGPWKSMGGRVNFDIVRYLGGDELAAMPLADVSWDRTAFDSAEEAERFSVPPITKSTPALFSALPPPGDPVKTEIIELACQDDPPALLQPGQDNRLSQTELARAICGLPEVREAIGLHLSPFLNPGVFTRLLTQERPLDHADSFALFNVATAGIWMAGLERRYEWPRAEVSSVESRHEVPVRAAVRSGR